METIPEIIYKYRSWNNEYHKKMLTHNQLYLSAPKDFNDPFDCRISKNHLLLDTTEKIEKFIDKGIIEHFEYLIEEGLDIEKQKTLLRNRLKDLSKYQQEFENINNEFTDKYLGVLSMSTRWNSILMWSHYGDFHKGYCIGFDEEKMRNSGYFGKGGNVTYSEKVPQIDPFDEDTKKNSFLQTHYKAKDWEYEQEYRLTKLFFDKPNDEPVRLIEVPNSFIREVIIGMSIPEENKKEIIEICNNRNIPIYKAYKDSFDFEVKRELIV